MFVRQRLQKRIGRSILGARRGVILLSILLTAALFGPVGTPDVTLGASFAVTNTNDGGPGSLRQAITDANASPGADIIEFNLAYPATIHLASNLVAIRDDLTIHGPGANNLIIDGQGHSVVARLIASGFSRWTTA
jgi:hypothetical protein